MFFNFYAYVHIGRLGIMVKFQYKRPTELKKLSCLCKVDICTILKSLCPELIYLSTAASLFSAWCYYGRCPATKQDREVGMIFHTTQHSLKCLFSLQVFSLSLKTEPTFDILKSIPDRGNHLEDMGNKLVQILVFIPQSLDVMLFVWD